MSFHHVKAARALGSLAAFPVSCPAGGGWGIALARCTSDTFASQKLFAVMRTKGNTPPSPRLPGMMQPALEKASRPVFCLT